MFIPLLILFGGLNIRNFFQPPCFLLRISTNYSHYVLRALLRGGERETSFVFLP